MKRLLALLILLTCISPAVAGVLEVIYPRIEERAPDDYGYRVLELALAKSGEPYRLRLSTLKMNQERARAELKAGTISVVDFGTSEEYERTLLPVYFPVDRGLSGYRLFIIHRSQEAEFAGIQTLDALRHKVAGQGPGWADNEILGAAGIQVRTAQFDELFRMVDAQRFDFYPLGMDEVYGFLARYRTSAPHSMVEEHVVLHYPFARLFFVQRNNVRLRDAILIVLKRAFSDGSFQHLLDSNELYRAGLARAHLETRTIIEIDNPKMTARFRAIPTAYFYAP